MAKMETTQMFISGWIEKQIVVYPYNEISLSHNKNQSADIYCNMNESQKHYAMWKNTDRKYHILYDSILWKTQNRYIHRHKNQIDGCQGLGQGEWRCLYENGLSFGVMKMFWNQIEMMVVQCCECIKLLTLKRLMLAERGRERERQMSSKVGKNKKGENSTIFSKIGDRIGEW